MKTSTKFLLTMAAATMMVPLMAADCLGTEGFSCESDDDCPDDQTCLDNGSCSGGNEGEGEGEGEGECELDATGFQAASGNLEVDEAEVELENATENGTVCTSGANQRKLYIATIVTIDGSFGAGGNTINGNQVRIATTSLSNGASSACSNSPSVSTATVEDEDFNVVLCPICLGNDDDLEDLAVQVTDGAGARTEVTCAVVK